MGGSVVSKLKIPNAKSIDNNEPKVLQRSNDNLKNNI